MLTRKQRDLLNFVHEHIRTNDGLCPSYCEMQEHMGLASKSGIHRIVSALEERGFVRRLPNRARCLEILMLPDQAIPFDRDDARQRVSDLVKILTQENKELRQKLRQYERAA